MSMYDWPETRKALENFWELIRAELEKSNLPAPSVLQKADNQMPIWTSPDLVIGQTCGWPYANQLRGHVMPFATFDFGLENCPPGTYQSVFIGKSKADERFLENAESLSACPRIAINGNDSQSGFHVFGEITNLPASASIPQEQRVLTGAHRNSVRAVAEGVADIAAIDAVAFELAKAYEQDAISSVEVIGYSAPKPGLPLITSLDLSQHIEKLFHAVYDAHHKLTNDDLSILRIKNVLHAEDKDYTIFSVSDYS